MAFSADEASSKRQERIPVPELSDELLDHILEWKDDRVLATICALNRHWRDFYLKGEQEPRVSNLITLRAILGALRRCTDGSFTMYHVVQAVHSVAPDLQSNAISVRELLRDASRQVTLQQVLAAMPFQAQRAAWRLMVTHDSLLVMSRPIECMNASKGLGLLVDDAALAARVYRLAADQGDAGAQFSLGALYEDGRGGLGKDEVEAVRLFRLAAEQGFAQAQCRLGFFFFQGTGGLLKNDAEVVRFWRLAADQGCNDAHCLLGVCYERGALGISQDEAEAARLYRLASDHGNAYAHFNLGKLYLHGRGLTQDEAEGARLIRLAADAGFAHAQCYLGELYEQGRCGLDRDEAEAARLYRLAADKDDRAQKNLARLGL